MTEKYIKSDSKKATPKNGPRRETIEIILQYSKALHIEESDNFTFETLLN